MGRARSLFLLASVFCSGAAVMVLELTAVRVQQPFFGSTNYVWTNVIAVVLAALSVGYAVGGRLADKRPSPTLFYAFMAVAGTIVAASAWAGTAVCQWFLPLDVNLEGITSVLVAGSLGATLVLYAPATLVLGTLGPFAIRLLADAGVGKAAGRVFAISTIGSIFGTYLPTLYLVEHYGSRNSILFAAGLLIAPAVIGLIVFGVGKGGKASPAALIAAAVALAPGVTFAALTDPAPNRGAPPLPREGKAYVLAERESEYQYLTVREDQYPNGTKEHILTINEGVYTYHSFSIAGQVLTDSRYYDDYALLPLLTDVEPGEPLRGCVVGLAGGVTVRQWHHFWSDVYDLDIDGAEIDPEVVALGREYFHLPREDTDWLNVYTMDGRQMLALHEPDRRYHMMVVDAFAHELYIPFHLGTVEFFQLCKDRLEPGGVFQMNVYATHPDSPNLTALENTLAKVFGKCQRVGQSWGTNYLLMARNGEEPADATRLAPARIEARLPGRADTVSEWGNLLAAARLIPSRVKVIEYDPDGWLLTDDHAPLEQLTDRFLERLERETMPR